MDRISMIPVASATSGFEAKLMPARLGSEGVVWELRPDVDGVYPVSAIEILVPAAEVARARDVLSRDVEVEVEGWTVDDEARGGEDEGSDGDVRVDVLRRHRRGLAAVVLVLVVAFMVARLAAMG